MKEMAFALRTALHWKIAEKLMLAQGVVRDEFIVSNFALAHTLNGQFAFILEFFILLTFFPLSPIA